ncbi:MAG: hypothetical protein H6Q79_1391 [Deltaproteobacteria bacterium]|nr:hypothetical protein [Deltaproteobacteria bacterium]
MGFPLRTAVVLALVIAVLAAFVASAGDSVEPGSRGNYYWFGNFGLYEPGGDIGALHTGWNLSGGVGLRVHPNVAVESTLAFLRSNGASGDLWAIPLTLGARLIYPTPVFEPYAGIGSGVSYVDLNRPGGNDTSVSLVDYLSLGADAWLNRNTALNAEMKYQFMNSGLTGANVNTSGVLFTLGVRRTF